MFDFPNSNQLSYGQDNDMGIPLVLVSSNVPVGYTVPKFPALHFPIGGDSYDRAFLYYTYDIWRFTVFWTLIFTCACYAASAGIAMYNHKNLKPRLWILSVYLFTGGFESFFSGTVTGLMLAAIYKSGLFAMSTWIPFAWALAQTLFLIITSYSMTSAIL